MARDFTRASSHYLNIDDAPIQDVPFSVASWFAPGLTFVQDLGEWTIFASHRSGATDDNWFNLRVDDSAANLGKLQANGRHQTGPSIAYANMTTGNTVNDSPTGQWNHAIRTSAAGDHDLYLNGDTANKGTSSDATAIDWGAGLDRIVIGRFNATTPEDYWDGLLAWVVGWNVKLSEEEAVQLAQGRHPMTVRPANRVFVAPVGGQHSPEIDLAWAGKEWTVNGATGSVLQPPIELWKPDKRVVFVEAPTISGGGTDVARLDAAVASNTNPMPYTVSAGIDRALIVAVTQEIQGTPVQLTVDYGGQTMTPVVGIGAGDSPFDQRVDLYYLNDAGIEAAVGGNITVQGITGSFTIHAASYVDALQTTPTIVDSEANIGATSPLANIDISSVSGAAVCSIAGSGNFSVGAWGGTVALTEQTDLQSAAPLDCSGSFADRLSSATETVDCECTWTAAAPNRSAGAALLLPAASQGAVFSLEPSTHIAASGENTTGQLDAPATGNSFGGGRIQDDENPTDNVDLAANEYREDEWCIKPTALAVVGATYEFRVVVGNLVASLAPVGTPKWTIDSGSANVAPTVSAGADLQISLPGVATLDGTVSDDGLPDPPGAVTQRWTKVSGPGNVEFADETAVDTTAAFSLPGLYVLRLTADDSELQTSDDTKVTVLDGHLKPGRVEAPSHGIQYPIIMEVIMNILDGWTPITEADLEVYQEVITNLQATLGAWATNQVETQHGPKGGNTDLAERLGRFLEQDGGLNDIAYVTGSVQLGEFSENGGGIIIPFGKNISGATSGAHSYHVCFVCKSPGEEGLFYDLNAPVCWWTEAKFPGSVVIKARKANGNIINQKDDTSVIYGMLAIGYDAYSTGL